MKRLRILFDGTEITETPIGWRDIVSSIKRNKEINSIFITTEAQLTFKDDGYDYLMNKYNESFTTSVSVELQEYVNGSYQIFFTGIIFLRSAEIDRQQCTIKVEIEDNSFYSKIDNNKGIEVFPFAEQTKNSASDPLNTQYNLTACAYIKMQMFDPADGTTIGVLVNPPYSGAAYPVFNLFEYIISFMTDNTVGFSSPLFGVGGDYEGLVVTCGIVLRQYDPASGGGTTEQDFKDHFPKISFQQLFNEVNKKINIGMYVDYSYTIPTIIIDRAYNIRTNATTFRALNILGLTEKIDEEQLYSSVRLGSNQVNNNSYLHFPEDISFVGFKEEQFIVIGESNIDSELDLVSNWIISSNEIEDLVIQGADGKDDNLFFVMCDTGGGGGTYIARQGNLENQSGLFPVYYNLDLNGAAVMDNYFGGVPLSIAQYLGNNTNNFRASRTTDLLPVFNTFTNIQPQDDFTSPNFDTNGRYNPANGRYTAYAGGLYTFELHIKEWYVPINTVSYAIPYYIEHYDSLSNLIERRLMGTLQTQFGFVSDTWTSSFTATTSDYFVAVTSDQMFVLGINPLVLTGSYFACINAVDGGGPYKTFDPADYPVVQHQWEYPLTFDNFKTIAENQTGQIEFSRYNQYHYSGWIDSIKFKRFSDEMAQFITYRSKKLPETQNAPPDIRIVHMVGQLGDVPFDMNPDLYGDPFNGSSITNRLYFFLAGNSVNITVPATYLSCDFVNIYITKFGPGSAVSTTTFTSTTINFLIEPDCNYIVQLTYDLAGVGNTWPSTLPEIVAPALAGQNGSANIRLISPSNPADYTFLWSTGATTQSITAPAGNYSCVVTNTNPGTYDHNIIIFNIQIPVSETGA